MTPQLENGYTRIANEIMDALARFRLPGEQRQCLDFILRKTYGYNKKEDCISNSQFCTATGMDKGNVSRALRGLVDKKMVVKKDNGKIPTYCFNKDFRQWVVLSKLQPVVKIATNVVKKDNKALSILTDTKDSKDNITKDKKNTHFRALDFLLKAGAEKQLASDWLKVRKTKRLADTETALTAILKEIEKTSRPINEILKICCVRSWGGFKDSWPWREEKNSDSSGKVVMGSNGVQYEF
jgi:phage replication O-like protein O